MRRDSIFYKIFQQSPHLLFELLPEVPVNSDAYRFDSVAVKEPKFEIDGVFLPPDTGTPGVIYLCEVQFQKDEMLYERLFSETFLYFYRNRARYSNWQAVTIYPSRKTEQLDTQPYQPLLDSNQVHRIYLDELGDIRDLPVGVALMVLTTLGKKQAPVEARYLIERSVQEAASAAENQAIIDMVAAIMMYRFTQMSRAEVEAMLVTDLKKTRVYQEAKDEGIVENQERELERQRAFVLRLLEHKLGGLSAKVQQQVMGLPMLWLEDLGEALLDFDQVDELVDWLAANRLGEKSAVVGLVVRQLRRRLGQGLVGDVERQIEAMRLEDLMELSKALVDFKGVAELEHWLDKIETQKDG
jgi:predicted transposase/invertase (TIGR01784 family)